MSTEVAPNSKVVVTTPSIMTSQKVIEIFASLGLPVCDDPARIAEMKKKYTPRYRKDLKNPDPAIRAKAQEWFFHVDQLDRKLSNLHEIVYLDCKDRIDTTIAAFLASGTTTVTKEMLAGLRKNIENAQTDEPLTDQFLNRYLQERGLQRGTGLVVVNPVADFTARSGLGRIELAWKKPAAHYEQVEIERLDTKSNQTRIIYQGSGTNYADEAAKVGTWYSYRAYSINRNVRSTEFVVADTQKVVCIGEIKNQRAQWQNGKIRLTWERPAPDAGVLIFRRNGKMPALRRGTSLPMPESLSTRQVFDGSGSFWEDTEVSEGDTYHYLIVARFGISLCSHGVTVQATVPKMPAAPTELAATFGIQGSTNVVALEWSIVTEQRAISYVLVRREGSIAAASPQDGLVLTETSQLRFLDDRVEAGRRYTYSLFTRAGDLCSRSGAFATPVDILPEVNNLVVQTGDATVELIWEAPLETDGVIVRRRIEPPRDALDGLQIPQTAFSSARDVEVINGRTYHYLVCCRYRPDGLEAVFSKGLRISATPMCLPDPVHALKASVQNLEVFCSWPQGEYNGTVTVYRSERPHGRITGERLDLDGLTAILREIGGESVVSCQGNRAVDARPLLDKPYYSSFTIAGGQCVVGATDYCVAIPDIDKLRLTAHRDGIVLQWDWPRDCTMVTVTRKNDGWPLGVDDPHATSATVSRNDYYNTGAKYQQQLRGQGHYFYVVYAQGAASRGMIHAAGSTTGSRADITWRPWTTLKYQLPGGKGNRDGIRIRLTWMIEDPALDFAGFLIMADQKSIPNNTGSGIELFRWIPNGDAIAGPGDAWISLDPIKREGWPYFYCKLILLDPSQAAILVIHPDVCREITTYSESATKPKARSIDFTKTPQHSLCPFCLASFPIDQILFKSRENSEPFANPRTFLQRLRNRPIMPPKGKGGNMSQKTCPECKKELQSSAGVQEDLVIGMVGAKYSGKSHYVASLVQCLESSGTQDMCSALIPLDDHTISRYRKDFYHPLFESRLELAVTAGVPPPLVYDLTIHSRLGQGETSRSVVLALDDTAGESLDNQDLVRHMVQYLRVASGIIFLIDPLQSNGIKQFLPTTIRDATSYSSADPFEIITRVIQKLKNSEGLVDGQFLDKPIALVMTKCDVLHQCGIIPENRLWAMEQRHVGKFRRQIHDDMSGMMGELFLRTNMPAYQAISRHFRQHAFFGVSATGCTPNKRGRFPFIAPWRVADPLFWLMAELGIIPAVDE